MIVTCDECSTSFQLDESRIPASGAQVRCSRCKHAFFLSSPSASQSEVVDSIAEEAAHDPMSSVPPVVADVPEPEPEPDEDEEDWQFSEEIRVEGDEDLEPESDFGVSQDFSDELDSDDSLNAGEEGEFDATELEESSGDDESIGLDADTDSASGLQLESSPEPAEPVRDESDFGSVDDFSSLMEDDDVEPVDLGAEIESELETADSTPERTGVYAEGGRTDDLGDPESWDLVGNHDFSASKSAAGSMGTSFQDDALGSGMASEDQSGDAPYEEEFGRESRVWQTVAAVGRGAGWLVTIASVVGVLGLGLRSEWTRLTQSPQTVSVGAMTAETTMASWVETSQSGFILVVAGQVQNTGRVPLRPGRVQFALLDRDGGRLTAEPILAGERLDTFVLREAAPAELIASTAAAASNFHERPLGPGERRAFEAIVFENQLPEGAGRILLEIGDSEIVVEQAEPLSATSPAMDPVENQVEEESDLLP